MFIELTQTNGERFHLNVNHIIRMSGRDGKTTIKLSDNEPAFVVETPEQVAAMACDATGRRP